MRCAIGLVLLMLLTACTRETAPSSGETQAVVGELSWAAQVRAIREGESDRIEVTQQEIADSDLDDLHDLTVRELLLDQTKITDSGAETLATIQSLEHLRLGGAELGDAGLRALAGLPQLRFLNLPDATFTDKGLAALTQLDSLELLRFGSPSVTDAGFESIAQLPHLRFLHVLGGSIGGSGLQHLETMPQLESLYLDNLDLDQGAVNRLLNARRHDLHVHFDQLHHPSDPQRHSHD